jgi:hypothetical protein
LWEAATGQRMWKGAKDDATILRRLARGEYDPSPRSMRSEVPEVIDKICRRALSAVPEARFPTAEAFEVELAAYLETVGRMTDREIGGYVRDLFSESRIETQRIIEQQLAQLASGSARASIPQLGPDSGVSRSLSLSGKTPSVSFGSLPSSQRQFDETASTLASDPESPAASKPDWRPAPPKKRVVPWAPWILVVVAAGCGFAFWASRTKSSPPPPVTLLDVKSDILVTLHALPPEARFSIDDGPPLENPFTDRRPRDGQEHHIRAEAPGFTPITESVVFDDDVSLRVALAAVAPPAPTPPPVPSTKPTPLHHRR